MGLKVSADPKLPPGEHLLVTLIGIVADEAAKILGTDPELGRLLGDEVASRFSAEFGGDMTHIPKGRVYHSSRLHRRIYEEFTGANVTELARKYEVTVIHLYSILRRERQRDRAERQAQLPGVPEA